PFVPLFISAIVFSSCFHAYYSPSTANAPLFTEKGETRINVLACTGGESEFGGGEFQFATTVGKHIGIMVNAMFVGVTQNTPDWNGGYNSYREESGSGSWVEFAGGLFKGFGPKKKWVTE